MSWYLSAMPREWIRKITFGKRMKPSMAQEHWFDPVLAADCWRVDDHLYLSGQALIPQPQMLQGFTWLKEVDGLEHLCWENATDLHEFFADCSALESIELNGIDVSRVSDFSKMFSNCRSLKKAVLKNWKTNRAESMNSIFEACLALEELEIADWDVSQVRDFSRMFLECNRLKKLDLSAWNVSKAEDFSHMFSCCYELEQLDLSRWNTASARSMKAMFNRSYELQDLDLSAWDTANVEDYSKMFHQCRSLKILDLSQFRIKKDAILKWMFVACYAKLSLPKDRRFRTLKESDHWFRDRMKAPFMRYITRIHLKKSLLEKSDGTQYPVDELDSGSLLCIRSGEGLILWTRFGKIYANPNSSNAFTMAVNGGSSWLREIRGLQLLDTRYAESMHGMFAGNVSLMNIDVSGFNLKRAVDISAMFMGCESLKELDVSAWDTSKVENAASMFESCKWLRRLDVAAWNMEQLQDSRAMFRHCTLLKELDIRSWHCPNLQQSEAMFEGCTQLSEDMDLL